MPISDYIIMPSITVLAVGGVLWLFRNWLVTRLTNSISHEYSKKIEILKSELRQSENVFNEDLKKRSSEVESIRNAGLSNLLASRTALNERRILAVEQVWKAITDLAPAKAMAHVLSRLEMDAVEAELSSTVNGKSFLDDVHAVAGGFEVKNLPRNEAALARPFLSPICWSLYSAYSAIVMHSCLQFELIRRLGSAKYLDKGHVIKLIEVALPHQKETIDKFGIAAAYFLIEELEAAILKEFDSIIRGEPFDAENVKRAATILKEVEKVASVNNIPEVQEISNPS